MGREGRLIKVEVKAGKGLAECCEMFVDGHRCFILWEVRDAWEKGSVFVKFT